MFYDKVGELVENLNTFDDWQSRPAAVLKALPRYADSWDVYPFNSGYFMLIKVKGVNANALREHLLDKHQVGLIATADSDLRIAFSCLEVEQVVPLFETVHQAIAELRK